jgi:nucleotide-binding universal stress UspA family protein
MELVDQANDEKIHSAVKLLRKFEAQFAEVEVECHSFALVGDVKEVLVEEVDARKAEMIIIGTHGQSALRNVFSTPVSNHLIHNARCLVVVVK